MVIRLAARVLSDVTFFAETRERVVALTLDDGPHPTLTPRVSTFSLDTTRRQRSSFWARERDRIFALCGGLRPKDMRSATTPGKTNAAHCYDATN